MQISLYIKNPSGGGNYRDGRGRGRYDGLGNSSAIKFVAGDTAVSSDSLRTHHGLCPYHLWNSSANKPCSRRLMVLVHNYSTRWVCMCNCIGLYQEVNLPLSAEFCVKVNAVMLSFFFWCPQRVLNDLQRTRLIIRLLTHPLSTLSRQQIVSLSQSSCVSPVAFTDGRRGEGVSGAKSYDCEKAFDFINHSTVWVTPTISTGFCHQMTLAAAASALFYTEWIPETNFHRRDLFRAQVA